MSKEKKKAIGLKINPAVDAEIRQAAEKWNLSYIDIVEKGAGKLARHLLRQNKSTITSETETETGIEIVKKVALNRVINKLEAQE